MGKKPALTTVLPSQTHELFCPLLDYVFLQTEVPARLQRPTFQVSLSRYSLFIFWQGKVASIGLPFSFFLLSGIFEKGEDGRQGIFLCLATVGVTNGKMGLLASGASQQWGQSWGPLVPR